MNKLKENIMSMTKIGRLKIKINTLENENEVLKNTIKDRLYEIFMAKLQEPDENLKLKKDNKKLRKEIKALKEMIKKN